MKRVLVLCATSGLAQAFCFEAVKAGYALVLAARDTKRLQIIARDLEIRTACPTIPCLPFDVAQTSTHKEFLDRITVDGSIEGCFIACGQIVDQGRCEEDWNVVAEMIATNYTGIVSITGLLANYFAQRGSGFISCVTSVAGDRGRASNFYYGSTKAALNIFLEGLRARFDRRHVFVQTIKLGPIDTPMNIGVARTPFMVSPERAARAIMHSLKRRRAVVYVPWFWRLIMLAVRALPQYVFERLDL